MSKKEGKKYYEEVAVDQQSLQIFLTNWGDGILQGLCNIDEDAAKKVVHQCAASCVSTWLEHLEDNHGWDNNSTKLEYFVEKFNEHVKDAGPESHVVIEDENTVLVEFRAGGKCVCPLIANNVLEGSPAHCQCSNRWIEIIFERVTGRPTTSDLLAGVLRGDNYCSFRAHLEPANSC